MACTTILIGKAATFDGSTIIARNEDSPGGQFEPKKMHVVMPDEQPRTYTATASHVVIELSEEPMRYMSVPDALPGHGIWAAAGINAANVAMTATETITSNERVLGADPLVEYRPARGTEGEEGYEPEQVGGIGEEDMVTLVLPYIRSAREGVERLGERRNEERGATLLAREHAVFVLVIGCRDSGAKDRIGEVLLVDLEGGEEREPDEHASPDKHGDNSRRDNHGKHP